MFIKYPRTPHCEWSRPGEDDIVINDTSHFVGKRVTVTEKLDGECTSMYPNHIHARSPDSRNHPSRNWVKALHGQIKHLIPEGFRICGENLYAQHSIAYNDLPTYFFVFAIFDDNGYCEPWSAVRDRVEEINRVQTEYGLLPVQTVPVLYDGVWDENIIRNLYTGKSVFGTSQQEGYVVRTAGGFWEADFTQNVAKMVRNDHIQTDEHWMAKEVIPNLLKK